MTRIINTIELPKALKGGEPTGITQDLRSLVNLYHKSTGETFDDYTGALEDLFENDLACIVSYDKQGNERVLEGFAQYRIDSETKVSSLDNLVVDPRMRKQGVGKAIVGAVMSEARTAGAPILTVYSSPEAVEIYSKIGFRTDNKSTVQQYSPWMVIDTDQKLK